MVPRNHQLEERQSEGPGYTLNIVLLLPFLLLFYILAGMFGVFFHALFCLRFVFEEYGDKCNRQYVQPTVVLHL